MARAAKRHQEGGRGLGCLHEHAVGKFLVDVVDACHAQLSKLARHESAVLQRPADLRHGTALGRVGGAGAFVSVNLEEYRGRGNE